MNKIILSLTAGVLLLGLNVFAQDVTIDGSGNLSTGTSNSSGNLKVTGGSAEHGIVGEASGTGTAGIYGVNTDTNNYGILGNDQYGVYGNSSTGQAGYFDGSATVTGNLTVFGTLTGETDPTVDASVKDGVDWTELTGMPSGFADGIDNTGGSDIWTQNSLDIYYNSGNVGIGTTTPAGKLDVSGDICLGGVCRTTWPAGSGTGAFTDTGNLAYYNGGNVGIGTNSPATLGNTDTRVLHLKQPVELLNNAAAGIRLEIEGIVNGGITSAYNSVSSDGGIFVGALSNHRLGFISNSMEMMSLTPDGRLGIGTTSPVQPLHVQGSAYIFDKLGIGVASPTNSLQVNGSNSLFSSESGDFRLTISKYLNTDNASLVFQQGFAGHAELGLTKDNNFHIKVSPDGTVFKDTIIIDSATGNIGIGTSAPDGKLNIVTNEPGKYGLYIETETTSTAPAIFVTQKGTGHALDIRKMAGTSGSALAIKQLGTDNALVISNISTNLMVVESTGNVGIGTASPTSKLDVNSSTGYNQLRVRTSYTPTGSADINGNAGDISWDDNYVYIKTTAGWKRSALTSW